VANRRVQGLRSCSSCTLSFRKLWLDFGGALDMAFQSSPAILNRSALRAARQLHQVLVESLLLHLFELLFPLHCTGPAFQALALYLCLSGLDLALCTRVIQTCERICQRFEVCDKLLVRPTSLLGLGGRLLDLRDKRGVLGLDLVLFRRGEEAIVDRLWLGEGGCRANRASRLCARRCALLNRSLCMSAFSALIRYVRRETRTIVAQCGGTKGKGSNALQR
jgi:hypothetical protein